MAFRGLRLLFRWICYWIWLGSHGFHQNSRTPRQLTRSIDTWPARSRNEWPTTFTKVWPMFHHCQRITFYLSKLSQNVPLFVFFDRSEFSVWFERSLFARVSSSKLSYIPTSSCFIVIPFQFVVSFWFSLSFPNQEAWLTRRFFSLAQFRKLEKRRFFFHNITIHIK